MRWKLALGIFFLLWLAPVGELHARDQTADGRQRKQAVETAPTIEISLMGSLSKTDYGNNTYSTSRHYTGTFGYFIAPTTELELSYENSSSFLNEDPAQTSTTSEQSLGFSLIQNLTPPRSMVNPYIKGGVGQYNRQENGTISGIPSIPVDTKSPTGILGAGLRIALFRGFSLKGEGVTYLPDFHMSEAPLNFSIQIGLSLEL